MKKRIIRVLKIIAFLIVALIGLLIVYSINPYKASDDMKDYIVEDSNVDYYEDFNQITYEHEDAIANIIIIPGGKVKAEAYKYMASRLAQMHYKVTIYKPLLNLSILTGKSADQFIDPNMENIIIGHSLGGVTASMIASDNTNIDYLILLGSYSTVDISSVSVLLITAENDLILNQENYEKSKVFLPDDHVEYEIIGGNHGQFGWYGNQNKDGEASIDVKEQQDTIISQILHFIEPL